MKTFIRDVYRYLVRVPIRLKMHWKGVKYNRRASIAASVNFVLFPGAFIELERCEIETGVDLRSQEQGARIILDEDVVLRPNVAISNYGTVRVRARAFLNHHVYIGCATLVDIGEDTLIGPGVVIVDNDHGYERRDIPISQQELYSAPIHIGTGAWIGANATITKGVTIGEGAIIGAGAVVTRDIPPYAIAHGVPARVLKYRHEEKIGSVADVCSSAEDAI